MILCVSLKKKKKKKLWFQPVRQDLPIRPAYFRYLTYMAYHAFITERVDATVLEVGLGGLRDPTNLIPSPIVTGVSSLGLDHVKVLGHSLGEIAGHKGGIFKPGVPALTVQQHYPETIGVLRARAHELKVGQSNSSSSPFFCWRLNHIHTNNSLPVSPSSHVVRI
jgi:folylpolyglutamate synthase/dihydropteroate synthase